ncbi:MAG: hypothetical protein HY910_13040 [Desulfarculus sp.]|nr:hypothetical protein [Desulfarculus sp.]
MSVRVLYTECNQPLWVEVASQMQRLCGWQPVYWTGLAQTRELVAQRWPQAVPHCKLEAIRGLPAPAFAHLPPQPLDQPLLEDLAGCEGMVLRMLDRMDPRGSLGLRERLDLYYRYLGYWLAVLEHLNPQAVFFPIAPHMAYDYLLYCLCQRQGIPTLMLEQALITSLLYPVGRFEDQDNPVTRAYARLLAADQGQEPKLSPAARAHLEALAGPYQAPFYVTRMEKGSPALGTAALWQGLKNAPRRALDGGKRAWRILSQPAPVNYVKVKGRPFQGRPISHLGFEYYRWLGRRKKARLKALYQGLAAPPDLGAPFVYLPLHYQPEMSTMPTGGYYEDQRVLAGVLAASLPPGWRLYVKEHPVQVAPVGKGQYSRGFGFYRDLLALPNVSLVPLEQSSYQLIDHCRAVATISGQAAWEAVNRGKPALTFGHCWYRGCEGIMHVSSQAQARAALQRIAQGLQVDRRKVGLFAQAVEQVAVKGYVAPIFGREYGISPEENVRAISQALAGHWQGLAAAPGAGEAH